MLDNIFQGDSPTVLKWKRKEPPSPEIERPSWGRLCWWSSEQEFFRGFLATLCYSGSFLTFGMSAAVMGATLMELGCKTGRPLDKMSWVFFSQSFSALFGSILGGYLAERHNANVVLLTCVTIVAICLTAIPICAYSSMIFFFAVLGFNMGIIDTVANVQLIKIHGKKVSPRLQTLHFFYGIGAILSPALSRPFLRDRCGNGEVRPSLWSMNPQNSSDALVGPYANQSQEVFVSGEGSVVQYAYWNVALMQIPVQFGLLFLIVQQILLQRRDPRVSKKKVISLADEEDEEPKEITQIFRAPEVPLEAPSSFLSVPIRVVFMTMLGGLLLFLYDGLMGVFADFLVAYSRKGQVHFTAENSAYLDVVFWSLFAAGRFVSIFVAIFISPERMLIANLGGCFLSEFIMLTFYRSQSALWLGTSLVGLFMSSIFPSTLAFAETYIEVTGPVASCMVVTSAIGEMVLPVGVGQMFSRYGPMSFLVTGFVVSVIAVCVYVTIRLVARGGPSLNMPLSEFLAMVFCSLCGCGSNEPYHGDYTKFVPDSPPHSRRASDEAEHSDVTVSHEQY